jgi:hypothetical protein
MNIQIKAMQELIKWAQLLALMLCPEYNINNQWWAKAMKLEKDLESLCDELVQLTNSLIKQPIKRSCSVVIDLLAAW